jgi:homoserine O-succinyltransferase
MPLLLDTRQSAVAAELRTENCITVGLVNNMPDAAHEATERQFADLIRVAAAHAVVRLKLFAMPGVPRSDTARGEIARRYHDVSALWDTPLDGLIVTGAEPRTKDLKDEPYWKTLTQVVDWARENTASTIWSCLAAHAAVLHADGIERRPFAEKLYGVFECEPVASHPMTIDAAFGLRVPHSRYNGLPERPLAAAGYRILTRSPVAGVDMFARQDRSFHLFLQGHPEYESATLLREYRRDVSRYLRHERATYPVLPRGYFGDKAVAIANAFHLRTLTERSEHLVADFPMRALESGLESPWRPCAIGIYRKWFEYLQGRKADQRPLHVLARRAWRDWPVRVAPQGADGPAG